MCRFFFRSTLLQLTVLAILSLSVVLETEDHHKDDMDGASDSAG